MAENIVFVFALLGLFAFIRVEKLKIGVRVKTR